MKMMGIINMMDAISNLIWFFADEKLNPQHKGKPIAVILVGLPASGKTTYKENFWKNNPNFLNLSSDDYIERRAFSENITYSEAFDIHIKDATKALNKALDEYIQNKEDFIWDQTNITSSKRISMVKRLKDAGYIVLCQVMLINEETQLKRLNNENRKGKKIPLHILKSMRENFAIPSTNEGFDYVNIHMPLSRGG